MAHTSGPFLKVMNLICVTNVLLFQGLPSDIRASSPEKRELYSQYRKILRSYIYEAIEKETKEHKDLAHQIAVDLPRIRLRGLESSKLLAQEEVKEVRCLAYLSSLFLIRFH